MKTFHLLQKKMIFWLLTVIILAACTPATQETIAPRATIAVERPMATLTTDETWVRVYNQTSIDYEEMSIDFPGSVPSEDFGPLAGGTSSDFRLVSQAYSDVIMLLGKIDVVFVLEPDETVEPTLLPGGYYTYVLTRPTGKLEVQLIEGQEELPTQPVLEPLFMTVSGETAACNDGTSRSCLLIKYNRDDEWQLFTETIEGFRYEPGYEYELIVYKYTSTATLADGSTNSYSRYEEEVLLDRRGVTTETMLTLDGTTWVLDLYSDVDVIRGTEVTIEFTEDGISGSAGCNRYFAHYETTETDISHLITIGNIGTTETACDEALMQQEQAFLTALSSVKIYNQSVHALTLFGEDSLLSFFPPEGGAYGEIESITLNSPGPLSQITSPFTVMGESDFPFEGTLNVEVIAYEEGGTAVVGTGFAILNGEFGERSFYEGTIEFTPPTEPTPGRVIVTSISPMHGQAHHLNSIPVTLLPVGAADTIELSERGPEAIAIYTPRLGIENSGGTAHVSGYALPTFEQNLVIEILDEQGDIIGSGFTTIAADVGKSGSYEADVAYTIAAQTTGTICVQEVSALDGGIIHRTCITVPLLP